MRKVRVLILCFAIMALCGCEISKGNSSTEYSGESSTSKEDTGTDLDQGEIPPIEETMPFSIASDAKIYKYDSNNLLGLCAIYVNAPSEVIYVFNQKKDYVKYSKEEGFQVYGKDSERKTVAIKQFYFSKDDYWQYMLLKCDENYEIDGFFLTSSGDYHYKMIKNSLPSVEEYEYSFSKKTLPVTVIINRQSYNTKDHAWNEIEESTDVLQPDIQKD